MNPRAVSGVLGGDTARGLEGRERVSALSSPKLSACQFDEVVGAALGGYRRRWLPSGGPPQHSATVTHFGCRRYLVYADARGSERSPAVHGVQSMPTDVVRFGQVVLGGFSQASARSEDTSAHVQNP